MISTFIVVVASSFKPFDPSGGISGHFSGETGQVVQVLLQMPSLEDFIDARWNQDRMKRDMAITSLNRQLTDCVARGGRHSLDTVQATVSLVELASARTGPERDFVIQMIRAGGGVTNEDKNAEIIGTLWERIAILTRSRFQCNVTTSDGPCFTYLDAASALQRSDDKFNRQYPLLYDGLMFSIDPRFKGWGGSGQGHGVSKEFEYYRAHFKERRTSCR